MAECAIQKRSNGILNPPAAKEMQNGTFYLEEVILDVQSASFWLTDRCLSGYLFITQIYSMSDWKASVLDIESELAKVDMDVTLYETDDGIQAYLSLLPGGTLFYFSAPSQYLRNKVTLFISLKIKFK
ncbi:hypothetical protein AVEN_125314-1 [Araneus ventricosus]|uniref:Uncharacterized protein n=1 Tax=Araneus ventricosus TaxID=182803 RepID=A0A4Y2MEN5_ARAVE|nr:hypothetical protein AVEN_125314-1 [Araneus ventricosus]